MKRHKIRTWMSEAIRDKEARAAGSSAPACSAGWQFRHEISWTPFRQWHPAFRRAWWIGGQIGSYANDAYTVGVRICGLFVAVWWFLPNAQVRRDSTAPERTL